jgi:hypothetical protein
MSAPQQPSRRKNEPVEAVPPQHQLDPVSGPDGDSGDSGDSSDQDIDTAGTEADDTATTGTGPAAPAAGRPAIDRHR